MSIRARIGSFLKFMFFSSVKALRIKCDAVLVTSTPLTIAVPALLCKWIKRTPFIFEARDVWPEVPIKMGFIRNPLLAKFLYWFEKLVYRNASFIVPLSTGMDENIKRRYPNRKSTVIPNISEISRFSGVDIVRNAMLTGEKVVLYAGTFGNVNGIKYVVDLAYETYLQDASIVFHLYGGGKEKSDVMAYARERGVLDKNVFIFNLVPKQELPSLYARATVGSSFVIDNPVLWDNSANKFFDTLAASKPIVINHQGWQADVIKQYNVGFVLPPVVTKESATAFVDYMNDEDKLKQQSANAFSLAQKEYSLEVASSRYLQLIRQLQK
jgi:glycosyltransferase involved in cell wall biosynthesis